MKKILFCLLLIFIDCQKNSYLILSIENDEYEIGDKTVFVNQNNDTIIPANKYIYSYSDTIRRIGFVMDTKNQIYAINNFGTELFIVFNYDNGPDYLSDGLFRIIRNEKIGYANTDGEIVINPQYDCAFPFNNGRAKVSLNCSTARGIKGEGDIWKSNNWFLIDIDGNRVAPNYDKKK